MKREPALVVPRSTARRRRRTLGRLLPLLGLASAVGLCCGSDPRQGSPPGAPFPQPFVSSLEKPAAESPAQQMPPELRAAFLAARQKEAGPAFAFAALGGLLKAANSAHRFDAVLSPSAVKLTLRSGAEVTLSLKRAGCSSRPAAVPEVRPVSTERGRRAEYARPGMTEWWQNGPMGLEQGFTVSSASACPLGDRLRLELGVAGAATLQQTGGAEGTRIEMSTGKETLVYSDLFAQDAAGKALGSRMTLWGNQIGLEVEVQNAVYPVEVDPLVWNQQAPLVENMATGAADDFFGYSVAVSGNTAIVGAIDKMVNGNPGQGEAFVFTRTGTTWSPQATLVVESHPGPSDDNFGGSVALSGDTAVVGAPGKDVYGGGGIGEAFVYTRTGTKWSLQATLVEDMAASQEGDSFGRSVAVSGDTVVVGAPGKQVKAEAQGEVFVYTRTGTTWSLQATLVEDSYTGAANDGFGISVAVSGNTAVVGAFGKTVNGNVNQGEAFVFTRTGTTWSLQTTLVEDMATGAGGDSFGQSVALSGYTAVVGAYFKTVNGHARQGEAFVFIAAKIK